MSLIVLLSYFLPVCLACDHRWEHLAILSLNQKLLIYGTLIYLFTFTVLGIVCLRGLLTESKQRVVPFFFMLVLTELGIIVSTVLIVIHGPQLGFDNSILTTTFLIFQYNYFPLSTIQSDAKIRDFFMLK